MKLHIDSDLKTVTIEGTVKVSDVMNHLMSWFPEDWEHWSFVQDVQPRIIYKEVIVQKNDWRNPYWNPWGTMTYINTPMYSSTTDLSNPANLVGNSTGTNSKLTLNLNQI